MKLISTERKERQMLHLKNVIMNQKYYKINKFHVLNNEAAFGKSLTTMEAIAELIKANPNYKVVYVQKFANEDSEEQDGKELVKTVEEINGKYNSLYSFGVIKPKNNWEMIAGYLASNNQNEHRHILKNCNVICMTHNRYIKCCKGLNEKLITDADILIIDEFPNICNEMVVSLKQLADLSKASVFKDYRKDIHAITDYYMEYLKKLKEKYDKEMKFVNLQTATRHKRVYNKIVNLLNVLSDKENVYRNEQDYNYVVEEGIRLLEACKQMSERVCIYSNNALYIYDDRYSYKFAQQQNIILDANAGFDLRYSNDNLFYIDRQEQVFDYSKSIMNYYPISTSKSALKKYKNFASDFFEHIVGITSVESDSVLLVTNLQQKENMNITAKFQEEWMDIFEVYITHYGNIIGKNDWQKCKNCWILATPYMIWHSYIIQFMFYIGEGKVSFRGETDINITPESNDIVSYAKFKNEEIDNLKNSIVAGEMYQGIKRIAREKTIDICTINVMIDNDSILEIIYDQFYNIELELKKVLPFEPAIRADNRKNNGKPSSAVQEREEKAKQWLSQQNDDKILKSELVEIIGIKVANLSREIKKWKWFNDKFCIKKGKGYDEYIFMK